MYWFFLSGRVMVWMDEESHPPFGIRFARMVK